ncbi:MAG: MFS transporter, partial [Candidatus Dormibacteria bacterium]
MRTANRLRRRGERGTEEGLTPRLWLALVVLCVGQLMIVLDTTVVNVALPVLQRQLGFSQDSVAWVIDAYLITFGGLLLLAGRLGDLLGRRRVFLFGIVLFSISSLACGLAGDQTLLIAARFLQGAGAAVMAAMVLGILVTLFPEPRRRVLAMSVYAFVASAGASLGLLVGGLLTQAVSWHWIFFVNVPIGALVLGLGAWLLPSQPGRGIHQGVDLRGALLVTATPTLAVGALVSGSQQGWAAPLTLVLFGLALAGALLFLSVESRARNPLVPLGVFSSRARSGANLTRFLFPIGFYGSLFMGSMLLQRVLGYGAIETGLAFLPASLSVALFSLVISKRVVARFGARATVLSGLALVLVSLLLLARVPVHADYAVDVLPAML